MNEFTANGPKLQEYPRGNYNIELIDALDDDATLEVHSVFDGGVTRLRHTFTASDDPDDGERGFSFKGDFQLVLAGQTTFPLRFEVWKARN